MNKIFNLVSTFKAKEDDDGSLKIRGMASTSAIDRAGDVIVPEAWSKGGLENFKNNPIILFNHNYDAPIGRATKMEVTEDGLMLEAKISKSAPNNLWGLIKDGVLGTFSVGFLVKDADFMEETGGLKIKDAELFETSVVSVPCNQAATFSVAKSFDTMEEYKDFTKQFTNSVDLAGQLSAEEVNASKASNASEGANTAQKEIEMSGEVKTPVIDMDALAKQVAAEVAMKQAKEKAAEEAKAKAAEEEKKAKEAQEAAVKQAVEAGVSGTEKMIEDLREELNKKDADMASILDAFKKDLEAKEQELTLIRESKRRFVDRGNGGSRKEFIKANSGELLNAHLFGVMTNKGWDNEYTREVFEKAGMDYTTDTTTGDLDQEVQDRVVKEIMAQTKVAGLFREVMVNGRATVLPVQTDTNLAVWQINTGTSPGTALLENRDNATANTYKARSVTMTVDRLISSTWMDNDVDEKVLVTLMPMLTEGVARAHARAVEQAFLNDNGTLSHVDSMTESATDATTTLALASQDTPASVLLAARGEMGKFGLNPQDLAYVVNQDVYYELIADPDFANLNEVGSMATKLNGEIGQIFGTPVVVTDELPAATSGSIAAFVVHRNNFVLPRLRGFRMEQDYEVLEQRKVIVATQQLGLTRLFDAANGHNPVMAVKYA